jgi:Zn-dependent protease with chaperone function
MFNHIIYFIVVLLVFSVSYAGKSAGNSIWLTLGMTGLFWAGFALYCRSVFEKLRHRHLAGGSGGGLTARYHRAHVTLSVLAIVLFSLLVLLFSLKYWILRIPGFTVFTVLQGLLAMGLFFAFLCTIWYFAFPAYRQLFGTDITRRSYIISNSRLNLPILFPWAFLSLISDLLSVSPWGNSVGFFNSMTGQMIFYAVFLIMLMAVLPVFIQSWWGCKPLKDTVKARELEEFLRKRGFKYRKLLRWPLFEGRMMTAGIMGIVSRYRYILVTDSLLEMLTEEELKAVLAHEMGHAKHHHLLFYVLFLIGYLVLAFGLFDIYFYFLASRPFFMQFLSSSHAEGNTLFSFALSLPMLVTLIIYFRYVMGFFMRHFERQADLYSAKIMGTPEYTIDSLEKIAWLSGKSRDVPSWHHFSIRQRVDCLQRFAREPFLLKKHNRFVTTSFSLFIIFLAALGYLLNFSSLKDKATYAALEIALQEQVNAHPADLSLYENLAMLYYEMEDYHKAKDVYEKILKIDSNLPVSLNNLAWLLATSSDPAVRDRKRALVLAKKAVSFERSPGYLDTLAEAYYVNGYREEAVRIIKEALSQAKEKKDYYRQQLQRFVSGGVPNT